MKHGVVFDIDDTLYLERDYVRSGFEAVGAHIEATLDLPGFASAAWRLFEAGVRGQTFDRALAEIGVDPTTSLVDELVRIYRSHSPKISMCPDAYQLIDFLTDKRIPLGIITDGPLVSQRNKAEALELGELFQALVFTDELGTAHSKPSHKGFTVVAAALDIPDRLIYIADNPAKDFQAPQQLGWKTLRVRRPGGIYASRPSGRDVDAEVECLSSSALDFFFAY